MLEILPADTGNTVPRAMPTSEEMAAVRFVDHLVGDLADFARGLTKRALAVGLISASLIVGSLAGQRLHDTEQAAKNNTIRGRNN